MIFLESLVWDDFLRRKMRSGFLKEALRIKGSYLQVYLALQMATGLETSTDGRIIRTQGVFLFKNSVHYVDKNFHVV